MSNFCCKMHHTEMEIIQIQVNQNIFHILSTDVWSLCLFRLFYLHPVIYLKSPACSVDTTGMTLSGATTAQPLSSTKRMDLCWSLCALYLHACQVSYYRCRRSLLLCLSNIFWVLINPLVADSLSSTSNSMKVLDEVKPVLKQQHLLSAN